MVNILCLKHGVKYNSEYVNKLYRAVKRNCSLDFKFYCMTDNPAGIDPEVNIITLPNLGSKFDGERRAWWYKMLMYRSDMPFHGTTVLYLDLDVVIINSIDKILQYMPGEFCICQDFNRYKIPDYRVLNTSVIKFESGQVENIYSEFLKQEEEGLVIGRLHGDQDFVTRYFEQNLEHNKILWPYNFIKSWKWEICGDSTIIIKDGSKTYIPPDPPVFPPDLSIIVFHGRPNPEDVLEYDIIAKNWC